MCGSDWSDLCDTTPPACVLLAYYVAGQIAILNKGSLFYLAREAAIVDIAATPAKERMKDYVRPKDETPAQWAAWMNLWEPNAEEVKQARAYFDRQADGGDFDAPELKARRSGSTYLEELGHCLMMQVLGTGISWFDDHARFPLELPRVETPGLEDVGWEPVKQQRPPDLIKAELLRILEQIVDEELLIACNPQDPDLDKNDGECPADHPNCCGRCSVLHAVRAAIAKAKHEQRETV
jgi:hypothetical protein